MSFADKLRKTNFHREKFDEKRKNQDFVIYRAKGCRRVENRFLGSCHGQTVQDFELIPAKFKIMGTRDPVKQIGGF